MKKMKWLSVMIIISMMFQLVTVPVKAALPILTVEQVAVSSSSISKGTTFTVNFVLATTTGIAYKDIYIDLPSTNTSFSIVNQGTRYLVPSNFPAAALGTRTTINVSLPLVCNDTKSNAIPLTINYSNADGVAQTAITEQILVTLADVATPEKTDTTKYKPEIVLTAGDIQTIEAGTTKKLSLTFKNNSSYSAKNVVINPSLSETLNGKVSLNQASMIPTGGELKYNTEQVLELSLTANGITEAGTYPITYKVQFQNSYNDSFTATLSGYIKVTGANNNSTIYISKQTVSPAVPVRDGNMQIIVDVQNKNAQSILDVSVWIEGLSAESFLYQGQATKKTFPVWSTESGQATFDYQVAEHAASGNYNYKVAVGYTDNNGNTILIEKDYIINLSSENEQKGALEITKMSVPSSGVAPETQFTVGFDVTNTGKKDLENVEISLANSTAIWAQSSSIVQIKKLAPAETKHVSYTLMAAKNAETMNIPVSFQIQYDALSGEAIEIKSVNQSLGVLVNGDKDGTSKPKVLVSSVIATPKDIVPGSEFELQLALMNTNSLKNIENVKMILSSVDAATGTSNIIPIGQSDSVFIGSIATQTESTSTIQLMIPSTFKGSVCDIKLSFTYEDSEGTAYDDQETIHLPIAEDVKITVSDVRLGKILSDGYSIELDFYNTGKGTLKNLMVDLEGEFDSTNSNYYVGDLLSGRMDIYSVHINGLPTEKIAGSINFTYEDGLGNQKELKVPVDLTYTPTEEVLPEDAVTAMSEDARKPGFPFGVLIIGAVVIAVVAFVIVRKKRRAV